MDAAESVEYATELANTARAEVLADYLRLRLVQEVSVPTPVAGAEWSVTVPTNVIWEVLGVGSTFITSGVVANRFPGLVVTDADGTIVSRFGSIVAVPASTTGRVSYWNGIGANTTSASVNYAALPAVLPLPSGWRLSSSTSSIDVGDAYSGVVVIARAWSVGQVYWMADLVARDLSFEAQRERRS